jgi:hypothetical protein
MGDTRFAVPKRVLFSGYAPVHFLCFQPIYKILCRQDQMEIWLSGGFRRGQGDDLHYEIDGFYDGQSVEMDRIIPFDRAREQAFDAVVCAHTSDALFPTHADRKVQIFHGVSFKNFAVRPKVLRYDYLCIPGSYHARRFRECGLVRPEGPSCLLTGFPKSDQIARPPIDRERLLRSIGLDPARPTVLFAPTGNKHNALEAVGREVISEIGARGEWNLLVKPHDHPKKQIDWFGELADLESDRVRVVRDYDIVPYLCAADLLLTDASSVAVEYTLLDRPMVFIDVPKLFKNVVKRGAPLDLETYGRKIGLVAQHAGDVVPAIEQALVDPCGQSESRRAMARDVFYDPGRAAERAASVVLHAAGLLAELPTGIERLEP